MQNLFLIGALFVLTPFVSFSQSDFRAGFIVTQEGDTLAGLVNYKGNKSNGKRCVFRKDESSESITYSPGELTGFGFSNGKRFVSRLIEMKAESKQIFLEYLINGIVDVFYYRDERSFEHYFIEGEDGVLHHLSNEQQERYVNGTLYVTNSRQYLGVLRAIFKNSADIVERVASIDLNHKELISVAKAYHEEVCPEKACVVYEKKPTKQLKEWGIACNANATSVSVANERYTDDYYYLRNSDFGTTIYPGLGAFFKMNIPGVHERTWLVIQGFGVHRRLATQNSFTEPAYDLVYENNITIKQTGLNTLLSVQHELPGRSFQPYLTLGVLFNYMFLTDYKRELLITYPWSEEKDAVTVSDELISKSEFGLTAGAGSRIKYSDKREIFVELRYSRGAGLGRGLTTNTLSVTVGVPLSK